MIEEIKKVFEKGAIDKINRMCEQSLDPDTFAMWEKVKYWLHKNRHLND